MTRKHLSYLGIALVIFGIGGWVTTVEFALADGETKQNKTDNIMAEQHALQKQQGELLKKMDGQLSVILILLGVKDVDSLAARWEAMPQSPPLDSDSQPIEGGQWLLITDDYLLGRTMKWHNDSIVMVRVEWDVRSDQ